MYHSTRLASLLLALALLSPAAMPAMAQHGAAAYQVLPPEYGPFSAHFLAGGEGLEKPVPATDPLLKATTPWTMTAWVEMPATPAKTTLIAGVGDAMDEESRFIAVMNGRLALWFGKDNVLTASAPLTPQPWHFVAAVFDGQVVHLYCDGADVAQGALIYARVAPVVSMAPDASIPDFAPFGGHIALLALSRAVMSAAEIAAMAKQQPDFSLVSFEEGSKPWPVQTRGQAGYRAPQDPATLPRSAAPFSLPVAGPEPAAKTTLRKDGDGAWTLSGGWRLTPAPKVTAAAEEISKPGFRTEGWWGATVPGTVLTTMVDRGVYPDPDYGLNNMAIPESLNKQDYWYRAEFAAPKQAKGERRTLVLEGINYRAEVWLNGRHMGQVTGAFERGVFDVTDALRPAGSNALAIRISPPPHPGIPQEQSILGGPGENGGMMCLDGPTFVATEGWDWIPAERDRDSGLWQDVRLVPSGAVMVGDPQVITALPRLQNGQMNTTQADVAITVPLKNGGGETKRGKLMVSFEGVEVTKEISVAAGGESVELKPAEFPQLHLTHPRLWWPNGYGKPELYHLKISFDEDGGGSSSVTSQFGVREVTYELSLFDNDGRLRRVEYSPVEDRDRMSPAVDVSHYGMREVSRHKDVPRAVASIAAGADGAPSLHPDGDLGPAPYLVIKVNDVRNAARGGNWGMDDARKRVSRERLEPYFRLHRDAGLNIIRNWVGQSTEETFYELADEYGLMVWNDFWDSTQNYNVEAEDPQLFLENAKDTIERYRNHPSIVLWCGRNEGVPQPIINEGLIRLIHSLDGTRYYSPSSNEVNLQGSGPYSYQEPAYYYSKLNHGFSVETGTPSLPTREWFDRWIPRADHWPVSDDWAYHDWHQAGNGGVTSFDQHMEAMFGAATNLDDYVRKAQMMNYVDHRAIFEGMNAHLWSPNSGRMLWMTQPAWPSTMWEIFTSDYDTQASYYGVKKACEPMHVQLDLPDDTVAVANTTTENRAGLKLSARAYGLDNKLLLSKDAMVNAGADAVTPGFPLPLGPLMGDGGVVLVRLELRGADGQLVSDNFYWRAAHDAGYRALDRMGPATVNATVEAAEKNEIRVKLRNTGRTAALENKLTLLHADGSQVLPAYYSDNYVSLLPGEELAITISIAEDQDKSGLRLELHGWNATPVSVAVQ
jgi:Exo-beta-D-glucosaminidase Ig-fold domain/Concanavalin A-like lectin/glucanases superfamily/Glycosyl hydrolases family 2/Glycosyl hydrolases family 2, sugar binding domain/Glycosyl hydrolases family 2, TIM barrel domain